MIEKIKEKARENFIPVIRDKSAEFLFNYVKENKPTEILEIGTAVGYSSILMKKAFMQANITTIEKSESAFNEAKDNFKTENIEVSQILGDALYVIENLPENRYDLIFLDGPKGQYLKYYKRLKKLLSVNGVIIADNVLYHGLVESKEFIKHKHRTIVFRLREFIRTVFEDAEVNAKLIKIEDGLLIIKKIK